MVHRRLVGVEIFEQHAGAATQDATGAVKVVEVGVTGCTGVRIQPVARATTVIQTGVDVWLVVIEGRITQREVDRAVKRRDQGDLVTGLLGCEDRVVARVGERTVATTVHCAIPRRLTDLQQRRDGVAIAVKDRCFRLNPAPVRQLRPGAQHDQWIGLRVARKADATADAVGLVGVVDRPVFNIVPTKLVVDAIVVIQFEIDIQREVLRVAVLSDRRVQRDGPFQFVGVTDDIHLVAGTVRIDVGTVPDRGCNGNTEMRVPLASLFAGVLINIGKTLTGGSVDDELINRVLAA